MSRKRNIVDKAKFAEKMSTYMMLMGYIGDYRLSAAKELNRRIWKRNGRLSKKRIRRLQHLLCAVDSETLLAFTVCLGKLIWSESLKVRRRIFEKRLLEKVKERSTKKTMRRGRPRRVRARRICVTLKKLKGKKGNGVVPKFVTGFHMRPVWGSIFRIKRRRRVSKKKSRPAFGRLIFRLAIAMNVLCYRNVWITSDWEFWTVCYVHKICGYWRSVAIDDGLSSSFVSVAEDLGLCVVSSELLERMESCFSCSYSSRYLGSRLAE